MAIEVKDLHWTAGFLEGEGTFSGYIRRVPQKAAIIGIAAAQAASPEPLFKLAKLFGGTVNAKRSNFSICANPKPLQSWGLNNYRAVGLMMALYPLMSPRRQEQIQKVLAVWRSTPPMGRYRKDCRHGHLFDEKIPRASNGRRRCLPCERLKSKRHRERKRMRKAHANK